MKPHLTCCLLFVVLPTLVAGCSTVERRANQHAQMLAGLPPDVVRGLREGKIDIGYTAEMVYVALGPADRVYSRRTTEGTTVVWVYTRREPSFGRTWGAGSWGWYGPVDLHGEGSREYDAVRVEFRDGKVFAVERRSG